MSRKESANSCPNTDMSRPSQSQSGPNQILRINGTDGIDCLNDTDNSKEIEIPSNNGHLKSYGSGNSDDEMWPTPLEEWDLTARNRARNIFSPLVPQTQHLAHTSGIGDEESPQFKSGSCPPNSSPMTEYYGRHGSESPVKDDHWHAKNSFHPRRKDDDDSSGGSERPGAVRGWSPDGKGSGGNSPKLHEGSEPSMASSNLATQYSGSSKALSGLCGSAAWFIPQNGRYEQLLPRYQLIHTSNWYKAEGKIPCGISEHAKFHQGRYRCYQAG
ncbi:uncharacterized protein PV09_00352 [Verruconis gallopava]|uniref:Uncharacterized protein n=1 Tax=Verruconis gallopava TaxID=253628 RepID=A0A0D2AS25_9PEZI|nr:uncharacterized protein PV09_00352 [Verruconis gallopava]KIW09473.1 hypothetical protein PV09_00352 [Verruconis gallopava]